MSKASTAKLQVSSHKFKVSSNNMRKKIVLNLIAIFLTGIVFAPAAFASWTDGAIDATDKYAWGENIGWLDFGTSAGDVSIADTALTGYVWGENIGWISLNCSNDSTCGTVDYGVINDNNGNLSGYAWSENIGWINFAPVFGGVSINSSGEFLGYAWNESAGWIVFNCATTNSCGTVDYKVKTDWRPRSARAACDNSTDDDGDGKIDYPADPGCSSANDTDETDAVVVGGGGLPPAANNAPTIPVAGFGALVNNGDDYTNTADVVLSFFAGQDIKKISVSNNADFADAGIENYQPEKKWMLAAGDGKKTVYIKFYTQYGKVSQTVFDNIILDTAPPKIQLFEMPNVFFSGEDIYFSGITESKAKIAPRIDGTIIKQGFIEADSYGKWKLSLGRQTVGMHRLELKAVDLAGNESSILAIEFKIENRALPQTEQKITPKPLPQEIKVKPFKKPEPQKTDLTKTELPFPKKLNEENKNQPTKPEKNAGDESLLKKESGEDVKIAPSLEEQRESKTTTTAPSVRPPRTRPNSVEPQAKPELSVQPLPESLKNAFGQFIKNGIKNIAGKLTNSLHDLGGNMASMAGSSGKTIAALAQGGVKAVKVASIGSGKAIARLFSGAGKSVYVAGVKISNSIASAVDSAGANIAQLAKSAGGAMSKIGSAASEIKLAIVDYFEPLQIYDLQAKVLSSKTVEIVWQTNHKATSKVNYGLTRVYNNEKQSSEKVKTHSIILTGLLPDTIYHYEVLSQNGSYAFDADRIFITSK